MSRFKHRHLRLNGPSVAIIENFRDSQIRTMLKCSSVKHYNKVVATNHVKDITGRQSTSKLVPYLIDDALGIFVDLLRQRFHHVGAGPRVDDIRDSGLLLEEKSFNKRKISELNNFISTSQQSV